MPLAMGEDEGEGEEAGESVIGGQGVAPVIKGREGAKTKAALLRNVKEPIGT